jgi:hypothetical protein
MKINIDDTKFMNKETDIKHKDVVTIGSEGAWENSEKFKKEDGTPAKMFKIVLALESGEERTTTLNWTNVKLLIQAFGDDTSEWIGNKVRAWKTKSEKAKSGFTFLYVPTTWDRDDTGEWVIPEGSQVNKKEDEEVINVDEIPF